MAEGAGPMIDYGEPAKPDELRIFADLVKRMRAKQKEYFQTRDQMALRECRDLERRCDNAVIAIFNPLPGDAPKQQELFSG